MLSSDKSRRLRYGLNHALYFPLNKITMTYPENTLVLHSLSCNKSRLVGDKVEHGKLDHVLYEV